MKRYLVFTCFLSIRQIVLKFVPEYGRILAKNVVNIEYSVFNSSVTYRKLDEKIYQIASVCIIETDRNFGRKTERKLYVNRCQIGYQLPDNIKIMEGGV